MKINTLKLKAFGFLTIAIIYSCNDTAEIVSSSNVPICSNYTEISTLEVGLIHAMTKKYKENQLLTINDNLNNNTNPYFNDPQIKADRLGDARTIWFDLETLKAFVYQIEMNAQTQEKEPIPSTDLGIRIYYASYPDTIYWGRPYNDLTMEDGSHVLPENYQRRHTVIMIPTIFRDGHNVDFDPLNPFTFTKPLSSSAIYSPLSSTQMLALTGINKNTSNQIGTQNQEGQNQEGQNHGGIYPPPPGGIGLEF